MFRYRFFELNYKLRSPVKLDSYLKPHHLKINQSNYTESAAYGFKTKRNYLLVSLKTNRKNVFPSSSSRRC